MSKPMRMYSEYFGIRENAFAITPDPRYLYMSDRHREALAHLLFGTEEGGGFVQLTGEVGTGKTTICRAFLEQLPENVDVALLLSPPENAQDLLRAIASELRLAVPPQHATVRQLVELLNMRLLSSHADGRRTVVIIDEAQNILPEVLEQVRLLTNLETPTHKLLQVFLIGQPELREKLEQPGLRQVAQRITARYHLEPLSLDETRGYIRHRLMVAGCRQGLFSAAAIKQIFIQSQGIPRVINILCDRALLGAFATNKVEVSDGIVRFAAREWRGQSRRGFPLPPLSRAVLAATVAGLMLVAVGGFAGSGAMQASNVLASLAEDGKDSTESPPVIASPAPGAMSAEQAGAIAATRPEPEQVAANIPQAQSAPAATVVVTPAIRLPEPMLRSIPMNEEFPELVQFAASEYERVSAQFAIVAGAPIALQALLDSWGLKGDSLDRPALCDVVSRHGLQCLRDKGSWNKLRSYNRPALLSLNEQGGKARYLTVVGMHQEDVLVATSAGVRLVAYRELAPYWSGEFVLLWRPPLAGVALIGSGSAPWAIEWLHQALRRVDGQQQSLNVFDREMEARLRAFQQSRGLLPDGIAGPRTLIHLNNLIHERESPLLVAARENHG